MVKETLNFKNEYTKYTLDYIQNNLEQDYTIDWNKIDIIVQEEILKYPNLDYEKYIPLLKDKSLLYAFNKKILNNLNWDELTIKEKNYICRHNINFEYDKYWDKLDNNQKYLICSKNENFNYEKYWDTLNEESRTVIINKNDKFNFLKYWDELSLEQCYLGVLKTSYIEKYQENKIIQYLKENSYSFKNFISKFNFFESIPIEINGINILIDKIKLSDLNINIRQFIIKYLLNINITHYCADDLINNNGIGSWKYFSINENLEHIRKYNDIYIYKGILIDDFKFILREKKFKRIFNEK
jgi:hypothetical protein